MHRQLLGPLAAEWAAMRLQPSAALPGSGGRLSARSSVSGGLARGSTAGGGAGSSMSSVLGIGPGGGPGSLADLLGSASTGGGAGSLGGGRTMSFSLDDVAAHSPAHLKVGQGWAAHPNNIEL